MDKLKIGYFADGPWSHLAFEKIIQDVEIDVKFIVPRNDTTGYLVKTKDSFIEIYDIEGDIKVGDKLGSQKNNTN